MQVISSSRESLASQVYRALLEAIVVGELAPGSLHSVGKLAERIGVSRSPVREALITLADQGMVVFERNRGVRIQQTTAHDLEEVFSLRLLLEVPAAFRAAQQMQADDVQRLAEALGTVEEFAAAPTVRAQQELDFGFHRVILDAAGNRRLTAVIDNLWTHQRLRGVSTAGRTREPADIHHDHERIYRGIADGDAKGAAVAMRDHLLTTGGLLLAQETGDWNDASAVELAWLEVYSALGGPSGTDSVR
jgi:DNA-binding GntR family transcriptional regulator